MAIFNSYVCLAEGNCDDLYTIFESEFTVLFYHFLSCSIPFWVNIHLMIIPVEVTRRKFAHNRTYS